MKTFNTLFLFILFCFNVSPQSGIFNFEIKNNTDILCQDALISINLSNLFKKLPGLQRNNFLLKDTSGNNIPFQIIYNNSGTEELIFTTSLQPAEKKVLFINYHKGLKAPVFEKRTYAELCMKQIKNYDGKKFRGDRFYNVSSIKVPEFHTDHDALFKYEGPGWESEKVGYRFYLDWRNANDIFGKKISDLILDKVGNTDTIASDDSYHNMQEWGMDVFKVGNSLGIGSIGMMHKDSIYSISKTDSIYIFVINNGPVQSEIETKYFGWKIADKKYTLTSNLSITAGSRLTKCSIQIKGEPVNITTGLAKFPGTEFLKKETEGWCYIALYGKQTLVSPDDKLGIALLYNSRYLIKMSENDLNYYIMLKPEKGKVQYYFGAAWEQEPEGIKNKEQFIKYLDAQIGLLNNPPSITFEKSLGVK